MIEAASALLSAAYDRAVADREIDDDAAQRHVLERLGALADQLQAPAAPQRFSLFQRKPAVRSAPKLGLYIHGSVGRGKTMLMDLFYETVDVPRKRRVHFHAFMLDVHARIHIHRQSHRGDPIPAVAQELAGRSSLLCFDEFAVTDIADAMILGRLFTALFAAEIHVVTTSNLPPDRLYENGLNRALFVPFIRLVEERLEIVELDAETDYRFEKAQGSGSYFVPDDARAKAALDRAFRRLSGVAHGAAIDLRLYGRNLHVPQSAGGVARFGFADLCQKPLGAADFLAIGGRFHSVIVDSIPVLPPAERNLIKRFITMIDTFYDLHVRLIASGAVEPQALFRGGDGREVFEFERTVSRLIEMRSADYVAASNLWRPKEAAEFKA